jgi:hypothetical protein
VLDALAERLLEDETIEGDELEQIFQGQAQPDGTITPLPRYRHRPGAPALMPLPKLAAGLASSTLTNEAAE